MSSFYNVLVTTSSSSTTFAASAAATFDCLVVVVVVATTTSGNKDIVERLQIAYDLSKAIEHLHEHNVVHCNINAKNVGFNEDNKVQLFGFGSARHVADDDHHNHLYSTGRNDRVADVFAFTKLLFELLLLPDFDYHCGCHDTHTQQHRQRRGLLVYGGNCKIKEAYYNSLLKELPQELLLLIEKGWSKQPSKRPTITELRKSLYKVLMTIQEAC